MVTQVSPTKPVEKKVEPLSPAAVPATATPGSPEVEPKAALQPGPNLTQEERALWSRIASGEKEWETINEGEVNDFSLSEDPFKLPTVAVELQKAKKFKFRWIHRTPQRLDEVRNAHPALRWWVVNSTQPVGGAFDRFLDGVTGGVHLLDQILVFKPWWLWEKELAREAELAKPPGEDLLDKDEEERGGLRLAAGRRKATDKKGNRVEVTGGDILFRGEAEVDAEVGRYTSMASDSDLSAEI